MGAVFTLQIDKLRTEITHWTLLIGHLLHIEVGQHRKPLLSVEEQVEVAIEQSAHAWCVGND